MLITSSVNATRLVENPQTLNLSSSEIFIATLPLCFKLGIGVVIFKNHCRRANCWYAWLNIFELSDRQEHWCRKMRHIPRLSIFPFHGQSWRPLINTVLTI